MSPFLPPPDALLDPAAEHAAQVVLLILLVAASFALGWMLCADWPMTSRVWKEIGRYASARLKALFFGPKRD